MNSLLDSDDVPVDLFLPPLVTLLFPPLLVTEIDFVFCRLQNYVLLFFFFFFSKTQFAMQLPAQKKKKKKKTGLPYRLNVAFHNGLHRGADVRTYARRTVRS